MRRFTLVGLAGLAVLFGCSAGGSDHALVVGSDTRGGSTGGGPQGSGGAGLVLTSDAGVTPLSAHVESPPGVTVEFITLRCAGACADVVAVAKGGFLPYSFRWEDGSTNPARTVCPTSSTAYRVAVTDTGSTSAELRRAPTTTTAPLTANVLHCPDAGSTPRDAGSGIEPGGRGDGGPPSGCTPLPVSNGCSGGSGIVNQLPGVSLTQGVPAALRLTGNGSYVGQPWHYEIWGSSDGCSLDELLDAFQLPNGPFDLSWCVTASKSYAHAVLFYRFAPTDALSLTTWNASWCSACGASGN